MKMAGFGDDGDGAAPTGGGLLLHLFDEAAFDTLAQEDYPLPERTQETLENALFNAISAFMSTHQRRVSVMMEMARRPPVEACCSTSLMRPRSIS
jgi:hypothetical protein